MLTIALYFANVAWWLETEILDSESFVETTLVAMEDEATRDAAAAIIVDRLSDEFPLLRLLDSALIALFSDLIGREVIEGRAVGLDVDGSLMVEDDGGHKHRVVAGDVDLLP